MTSNVKKCVRQKFHNVYKMSESDLDIVFGYCNLGVLVSNNFNWSNHINVIVTMEIKMLGLLRKTIGISAPKQAKHIAYVTMVRSLIFYASQMWNPISK